MRQAYPVIKHLFYGYIRYIMIIYNIQIHKLVNKKCPHSFSKILKFYFLLGKIYCFYWYNRSLL